MQAPPGIGPSARHAMSSRCRQEGLVVEATDEVPVPVVKGFAKTVSAARVFHPKAVPVQPEGRERRADVVIPHLASSCQPHGAGHVHQRERSTPKRLCAFAQVAECPSIGPRWHLGEREQDRPALAASNAVQDDDIPRPGIPRTLDRFGVVVTADRTRRKHAQGYGKRQSSPKDVPSKMGDEPRSSTTADSVSPSSSYIQSPTFLSRPHPASSSPKASCRVRGAVPARARAHTGSAGTGGSDSAGPGTHTS